MREQVRVIKQRAGKGFSVVKYALAALRYPDGLRGAASGAGPDFTTRRGWGGHRCGSRARPRGRARFRQLRRSCYGRKPADESGFFGGRELRSASSMTKLTLEQQLCIPVRQRAQLSPPPVSSFGSKRRDHSSGHGSGLPLSGFVVQSGC
jgi:hypothetical protein